MAGRNQLPSSQSQARHQQLITLAEDPNLRRRGAPPPPNEDRLALLQRDLQTVRLDNQRLCATHVALQQELTTFRQDLHHLVAISQKIKAERDAEVRVVLDRFNKAEAEYRSWEATRREFSVVSEDVERLRAGNEELKAQLGAINGEIERAKEEVKSLPLVRAEMECIGADIEKGRAALEIERKNREINLQYEKDMEQSKLLATTEIDSLRAKLAEVLEKKNAREAAAAAAAANPGLGYGTMYASPSMVYGGGSYPVQYPMHQGQGSARITDYGQGSVFCGPGDTPRQNGPI